MLSEKNAGTIVILISLWLLFEAGLFAGVGLAKEALWIEGEDADSENYNQHGWYCCDNITKDKLSPGQPGVSDGDWLVHYYGYSGPPYPSGEVTATYQFNIAEGGTYTWWIRLNPFENSNGGGNYRYSLDNGAWIDVEVAEAQKNQIDLVDPGIDIRFIAWAYGDTFELEPGPHNIRVQMHNAGGAEKELHGGIDVMALVNYPWAPTGVIPPDPNAPPPGPGKWFVLAAGPDAFSSMSIIDVCDLLDKPAGVHGVLRRNGKDFEFNDGTPVKFWACVASMADTVELQQRQARFYAKYGINMVRRHPVEGILGSLQGPPGGRYFDSAKLDKLDKWFSILKENGIYMTWSIFYHHVVLPDQRVSQGGTIADALYNELPNSGAGKDSYGYATFIEEYQDSQWEYANLLLNHVNPYTGIAYKDDPALAIVECRNEDSIFWHFPLGNNFIHTDPNFDDHRLRLRQTWHQWVADRYVTDVNLAAAWGAGKRPGDSVSADPVTQPMYMYAAWEMLTDGPFFNKSTEKARMGDFIRCLSEMQRNTYETYQSRLRGIGYQAVTISTAWRAGGPAADAGNLWTDDEMEAIDRHGYFGGGAGGHNITTGAVYNDTHLTAPGSGILGIGFQQVEDKPFAVTEWTQKPPNQWKAEISPLMAFYGMGLQGWDALYHFAGSRSQMGNGWPSMRSYVTETPHYIGQFPALVFAVYNNHFAEGNITAARRLSVDEAFEGVDALSWYYSGYGYNGTGRMFTPDGVLAIGRLTAKIADGQPNPYKEDWYANWWNTTSKIIQSNTAQLTWDYSDSVGDPDHHGIVTVHSDKTQGIIGFAPGRTFELPDVNVVVGPTPFIDLLFTPLDNQPLIDSAHILITAMARDKQYGTVYSSGGYQLDETGGSPLLLEPVQATIVFKGGPITSVRPVDIYGVPVDQQVERTGNTFAIDGRYATYYYEVKRMVPVDCSQVNLDGTNTVNFKDFTLAAPDWKQSGASLVGDVDGSGTVDYLDIAQIAWWWLNDCN